jgi:hypothetical protein
VTDDFNTERATDYESRSITKSKTEIIQGPRMVALSISSVVTGVCIDRVILARANANTSVNEITIRNFNRRKTLIPLQYHASGTDPDVRC